MPSKLSADASDSPAAQKPVMHSGEPLKHRLLRAQMPVPQAGGWLPSRLQQLRAVCQPLITNLAFLKSAQTESKGVANKIKGSQTKSRGRKQNQKRSQTKSRGRKQNQGVANKIKRGRKQYQGVANKIKGSQTKSRGRKQNQGVANSHACAHLGCVQPDEYQLF